eukprot:gene16980-35210_t
MFKNICFILILILCETILSLRMRLHNNIQYKLTTTMSLGDRIRTAVINKFEVSDVNRVIKCWDEFSAGNKLSRYLDAEEKVLQTADCYVDGLQTTSFYDLNLFPWIQGLENNYKSILDELVSYESKERKSVVKGTITQDQVLQSESPMDGQRQDWLGPRDASGTGYGPEWKTLGLQDRSVWSDDMA